MAHQIEGSSADSADIEPEILGEDSLSEAVGSGLQHYAAGGVLET